MVCFLVSNHGHGSVHFIGVFATFKISFLEIFTEVSAESPVERLLHGRVGQKERRWRLAVTGSPSATGGLCSVPPASGVRPGSADSWFGITEDWGSERWSVCGHGALLCWEVLGGGELGLVE